MEFAFGREAQHSLPLQCLVKVRAESWRSRPGWYQRIQSSAKQLGTKRIWLAYDERVDIDHSAGCLDVGRHAGQGKCMLTCLWVKTIRIGDVQPGLGKGADSASVQ